VLGMSRRQRAYWPLEFEFRVDNQAYPAINK
jgi:hypothetical protein